MNQHAYLCYCTANYEMITSICAIIISFISLLMSIIFSTIQIIHNKKSVKPISNIVCRNYEDEIAIRIENVGIGPLIVKKLIVKSKDKVATDVISLMPNIGQNYVTYIKGLNGNAIGVGETKILIQVNPKWPIVAKTVREALKDMVITLEYQDIYGKKFIDQCNLNKSYGDNREL